MGHWGQCPHTPGMAGHCLVALGGHTHTTTTDTRPSAGAESPRRARFTARGETSYKLGCFGFVG
eukprot:3486980-Prymnesium_polylepis.1